MMAFSPFDYYGLSEDEISLSLTEIVYNGGMPFLARYYPDDVDDESWSKVYKYFKIFKNELTDLHKFKTKNTVCILVSEESIDYNYYTEFNEMNHLDSVKGISKLLNDIHINFDLTSISRIQNLIDDYSLLIVDNATIIDDHLLDIMIEFVKKGNQLIFTNYTAIYDGKLNRNNKLEEFASIKGVVKSTQRMM